MNTLHEESCLCQGEPGFRVELEQELRNELLATVLLESKNEYTCGQESKFEG